MNQSDIEDKPDDSNNSNSSLILTRTRSKTNTNNVKVKANSQASQPKKTICNKNLIQINLLSGLIFHKKNLRKF